MMKKYDYLIVGSGLFGSTFAYEMNRVGKKCLVIDKRDHIAGNCFTENKDGINIHTYGPHIFHTNDEKIWDWIKQFASFHNYKHSPKVNYKGKIYSFPINLLTLSQLWGVCSPEEALSKLESVKVPIEGELNLENWIISEVGQEIYETFVKGYTQKQWGKHPSELPSSIIRRLPIRTNFNDNYYFDKFQGIPVGGYTKIFEKLLDGIEVNLSTDYFSNRGYYDKIADKIVFTGKIDEFFGYKYGELEYRTLVFDTEKIEIGDFQGCSTINYTDIEVAFTRITEHKHFENSDSKVTWITKEFSKKAESQEIPYYPINDSLNNKIYTKYKKLAEKMPNFIFGGRLAEYKYYDMHQIIASALTKVEKELGNNK